MFEKFEAAVNSQGEYNIDGTIWSILIIVYYSFAPFNVETDSKIPTFTSIKLFEREMKYLDDNGFKVIRVADLGYNESKNQL